VVPVVVVVAGVQVRSGQVRYDYLPQHWQFGLPTHLSSKAGTDLTKLHLMNLESESMPPLAPTRTFNYLSSSTSHYGTMVKLCQGLQGIGSCHSA
jgi:hypothetical protein